MGPAVPPPRDRGAGAGPRRGAFTGAGVKFKWTDVPGPLILIQPES